MAAVSPQILEIKRIFITTPIRKAAKETARSLSPTAPGTALTPQHDNFLTPYWMQDCEERVRLLQAGDAQNHIPAWF